jgi:alkyl hydroperoxide reductase subunit AhpC
MAVRLGDTAPDFTAETTEGTVDFHDWLGDSWGVLFSHPKDFTPVCTTELGAVAKIKPEFDKRNVKVIGLSVDPLDSHEKWLQDIEETQGATVNFPMIGDPDKKVADLYDMIHPAASDTATVRSVFVIGPDKKIKLTLTYPASTGRNFDEILRVIDSLQLTASKKVATPANWKDGEDGRVQRRGQGTVPRRLGRAEALPAARQAARELNQEGVADSRSDSATRSSTTIRHPSPSVMAARSSPSPVIRWRA